MFLWPADTAVTPVRPGTVVGVRRMVATPKPSSRSPPLPQQATVWSVRITQECANPFATVAAGAPPVPIGASHPLRVSLVLGSYRSSPARQSRTSVSAPPSRVSFPSPPMRSSAPPCPSRMSGPPPPSSVSSSEPPRSRSRPALHTVGPRRRCRSGRPCPPGRRSRPGRRCRSARRLPACRRSCKSGRRLRRMARRVPQRRRRPGRARQRCAWGVPCG